MVCLTAPARRREGRWLRGQRSTAALHPASTGRGPARRGRWPMISPDFLGSNLNPQGQKQKKGGTVTVK